MNAAFRKIAGFLLVVLLMVPALGEAAAQSRERAGSPLIEDQRAVIGVLTSRTSDLEQKIVQNAENDEQLVAIRLDLEGIGRDLIKSSVAFRPRLAEINARLEQLGQPPPEGAPPEPDLVAAERDQLQAEKAEINAALGVAEDLSIRVNGLIARIADVRRNLFSNLLTKRYDVNVGLFSDLVSAGQAAFASLYRSVSAWLRFVVNFKLNSVAAAGFFAVVAAIILLMGGRRLFGHLFEANVEARQPTYLSRLSVAFWSTLMPSTAVAVFLGATFLLFDYFSVLRGDIGELLATLFGVVGLVYFVHRLGNAALAPRLPEWRLIPVESQAASILLWLMSATAAITGLDYFLSTVYRIVNAPLQLTVGEALLATVAIGLLVIAAGLVKPFADADGRPRAWPGWVRYLLFLSGSAMIVAAGLGYIGLARFISQQIVVTGAILATMYIGFLSSRAVSEEGAFARTALGTRFQRWFNLDESGLDQFGLLVSIIVNVFVVIAGVPVILLQWGFQPGDINAWVYRIATGIQIGNFTLSLTGILSGVAVFVAGYLLTRWFQGWLDGSVMARGRVEPGVRNSIRTIVGYAGLAVAALIGLSAAGIDFSNLALIAGGLSLGIGFGLQNIVQNFVSGLILLAERPFKAGDWIVAGPVSGTVKKISVRATEIETFQRQTVILPNSELINGAVGNWTHRNKLGRIEVPVGVAYGTDPRRVHTILLDLVRSHPLVLKTPEPFVLFTAFGDGALQFEVRAFLADITNGSSVQNDLRFAILDAFERERIDIPYMAREYRFAKPAEDPAPAWPVDDDRTDAEIVAAHAAREQHKQESAEHIRGLKRKPRSRKPDPA